MPGRANGIKRKRLTPELLLTLTLVLVILAGSWPAFGAEPTGKLHVRQVLSGDSFLLEDEEPVRLSFIISPEAPPDPDQAPSWAPAEAARRALAQLLESAPITIHPTIDGLDRYGRQPALVYLPDGQLLQTALLRQGHARIIALPADEELSRELLAAEQKARIARRGLWDHPYYRIRPARPSNLEADRFQVVIGIIVSANRVRNGAYLNFGRHWKTDVTVRLDRTAAASFEERYSPVEELAGRRALVRGWVQEDDGPLIEIRDHRLVELLD